MTTKYLIKRVLWIHTLRWINYITYILYLNVLTVGTLSFKVLSDLEISQIKNN